MKIDLTKLREIREALKLTRKELAEEIGCIENTISRWENGTTEKPLGIYRKSLEKFYEKYSLILNQSNPR